MLGIKLNQKNRPKIGLKEKDFKNNSSVKYQKKEKNILEQQYFYFLFYILKCFFF